MIDTSTLTQHPQRVFTRLKEHREGAVASRVLELAAVRMRQWIGELGSIYVTLNERYVQAGMKIFHAALLPRVLSSVATQ